MYNMPFRIPAAAAQLRGIQTGSATITNGNSSGTAAIAAITLNKGLLIYQYDSQQDWDDADECLVSGQISSTTQLTFARSGTAGQINVRWWVIEFKATSGITVQRGSRTFTGATENVTISSVNLLQAFPVISYRSPGSGLDQNHWISADLTSSTNLQLQAYSSVSQIAEWQVIENPSWTVAKYTDTLTGATKDTTISAVTLANAWLISTGRFSSTCSNVQDRHFRCGFTSATNIRATRGTLTANCPIVYFVITSPSISAQHMQYSISGGSTSNTQAIAAITVANSFLKQTGINVCHAVLSTTNNTGGRCCIRHTINSTTQIQANRQVGTDQANFNVEVLDFTNV